MPENIPSKSKLDRIKQLFNAYDRGNHREVKSLSEDGLDLLGEGKDSVVWRYGDKAIKVDKRVGEFSPAQQRQIFYTHRILHTLFPDNFLSPSLVTDQISVDGNSLSVWDVVEGNRFTSIGNNRTQIHEIEAQLRNAGLRPNFDFSGQGNIVTISGGKEVYVDTIRNFIHSSSDIDRLLDFMEKRGGYSENDKKTIISSGKRLIELQKV